MFKLKPEELKAHVLKRWAEQYHIDQKTGDYIPENKDFVHPSYLKAGRGIDKLAVYRNLKAMPNNTTVEQIDNIIGNDGWTNDSCSFCGERVCLTSLVRPDRLDVRGRVNELVYICEYCVSEANDILKLG